MDHLPPISLRAKRVRYLPRQGQVSSPCATLSLHSHLRAQVPPFVTPATTPLPHKQHPPASLAAYPSSCSLPPPQFITLYATIACVHSRPAPIAIQGAASQPIPRKMRKMRDIDPAIPRAIWHIKKPCIFRHLRAPRTYAHRPSRRECPGADTFPCRLAHCDIPNSGPFPAPRMPQSCHLKTQGAGRHRADMP